MRQARRFGRSRQVRYGAAVVAVVLGLMLRLALDPLLGERSPFILFLVSVIGAGLYGGVGPALLALVLSLLAGTLLFMPPRWSLVTTHPDALANIAAFAFTGGALIWMLRGKAVAERDVSEVRTTSARELSQSRDLLEAVIESAPDPIYVKDVEGRLIILNSATAAVYGQMREGVVGRHDREFLPPDAAARIEQVDREVLAGATRVVEELVLDSAKGWRDFLSTKSPLLDESGAITGLVGVSRDITERKLAEMELVRLNRELEARVGERTAQLEQANAELQSFAYSVAHDLRAPLRAMKGFSLALNEDYGERLDDQGREYLARIDDGASRLDLLIQDLLAYSRLSQAELQLDRTDLDVVVRQAVEQVAATPEGALARIDVPERMPCVRGHHRVLVQVVTNLLSNAVKFVGPGVRPEIRLSTSSRGACVRLHVEDNGIGIAPEHQARVFEVFQRLHGMTQYAGTGIGLAIVKKAMDRIGGATGVDSAPGRGSRFWIEMEAA